MRGALTAVLLSVSTGVPALSAQLQVSVQDTAGKPIQDAVIYAIPAAPLAHGALPTIAIDQVNRHFVPSVTVVQTGTAVTFPNSDNIRHSVYSFSQPKRFTLKLYAGTPANPIVFDKPGLVVLGCNIHDTMIAWVLVVDTPFFARTNAAGFATLANLRPGDYTLRAWMASMSAEAAGEPLHIDAGPLPTRVVHLDTETATVAP